MGMAMAFVTPPNEKKGVGNKDKRLGCREPTKGKASIEMDSKPLLKHQRNIKA
jgi:hypothetical protein